jgi:hypothetical protein
MGSQSNFPSKKRDYNVWTMDHIDENRNTGSCICFSQYFQYSYQNQGNEMGEVSMAGRRGILIAIAKVF